MKKRLLLSLALACGALSTFAYNVGDYIYTPSAKLKIIGENLVKNGNFSDVSFAGWNGGQDGTTAVSSENWSIMPGAGPNKENVLQSLNGGDEIDNYINQNVSLPAGATYVVSFKIMGSASGVASTTTLGSANYVDAYFNTDYTASKTATNFRQIFEASNNVIGTEWTEFSDTIVVNDAAGGLQISLGRLDAGTMVTDFEVHQVNVVFDTRIAEARIAYDRDILGIPEFAENNDVKEEFEGTLSAFANCIETGNGEAMGLDLDSESSMTDFLNELSKLEAQYLNANSYDLINGDEEDENEKKVPSFISYGKLTSWPLNTQKSNGIGDWHGTGGRWYTPHDGTVTNLYDYFPSSYALGDNYMRIEKALPAGKYYFQLDAEGNTYKSGKAPDGSYTIMDYDTPVDGSIFFLDAATSDTIAVKHFTFDPRNYKTYYVIADVPAGATPEANNVIVGFRHAATTKGGTFRFTNNSLRYISPTAKADVVQFVSDNEKTVQLNAAKAMIDSAKVVVADNKYVWGKANLQAGIDANTADYNALEATNSVELLNILDENGNVVADENGNATTMSVADSLTEVMRNMRGNIQDYYTNNAPYTNLTAAVAAGQTTLDDPSNANASAGSKAALTTAIANGQAALNAFAAQADSLEGDLAKSNELVAAIKTAEENLTATTATVANPSEIKIENQYFATFKGTNNVPGWDLSGSQTDNGRWKASTKNAQFENNTALSTWRGYTAYSKNKAVQTVSLTHAGAYEFVSQVYAYNENGSRDGDQTTDSHVYVFAKDVASADSIGALSVHTALAYNDTLGYGGTTPQYFVITYNKPDETPVDFQFGIDGLQNASSTGGLNTYLIGGVHVNYYGDYNGYVADRKSALQEEITKANDALAANPSQATDSTVYINSEKALKNAVLAAQSAIDGTTLAYPLSTSVKAPFLQTYVGYVAPEEAPAKAYRKTTTNTASDQKAALQAKALLQLKRAEANFQSLVTGIQGVKVADDSQAVKASAKGVYNLSGVKVANTTDGLAKGIYIVNGKKVIVK